ncbi:M23 family metallopeptidase [Pelagibacterium halotolerans]|uniref:Peptidase, M23 family n=1 Tax=Pelagibacterium halotolerans (strain DSM 22347 / JCM 15775 / CGMCC 1.7692 / B2) TaxID=1082931 RepID=G4RED5_PELHB|nr:M23 family metallopeptidase [Pelagibacterium halotolerans]AEQ52880.1 peptidase, M23 family [Pelagibacterium halotolerans B2]QJR17442.1 M23 family metallopeptidase [Pelagibacterium halotolerans]SEA74268.1 Murein DD-endopeptidase MepM and murein hydrolase activator NlpD, contain LysM domain [Pelagibacterium halotolerans]
MNAAQRNRHAALLKATGYEDSPALTVKSPEGALPQGREISFAWLAGTVLTGVTSFLLMAGALQVSFKGQDTFSTPFEALAIAAPHSTEPAPTSLVGKTRRAKPVTQTHSDLAVIEASIREVVDGVARIRNQPFTTINATLATAATALSEDIPEYDPVALLARNEPLRANPAAELVSTDIYGADVEGEVTVRTAALELADPPHRAINDIAAAQFVRLSVEGAYTDAEGPLMAYASPSTSLRELGIEIAPGTIEGVAENVTVMPKTRVAEDMGHLRTERVLTIREQTPLAEAFMRNGFTTQMVTAVTRAMQNVYPRTDLPEGTRLRILFGASRGSQTLIPYRVSIYDDTVHRVTVALTDQGRYVTALEPPRIEFTEEDTEEVNVGNLPSIYRSIWETGRKHGLDDATIDRIAAMYAYDLDLTRRVSPGDSIEILLSGTMEDGNQDLLYVALTLSNTTRELFRFQTEDGVIDFYNPDGETGKQFLLRRPLEGGGTLRSRYGYRRHPIFGDYRLHTGADLAARTGTPIYAGGDGIVEMAQWYSGYGRYVELRHANGYNTAYGHMSAIADGITPGTRVTQGQVIGYVGSTGQSTGPHLHYEIKINGNTVDPLAVKLPRANSLPQQYETEFSSTVAQVRSLIEQQGTPVTAPVTVAAAQATTASN